jgi:hypothetical protein
MLSNVCVNIAAAKKATAREGFRPDIERVTQRRREPTSCLLPSPSSSSPELAIMYRFLGTIRVPAEMFAGFNFGNDGGRLPRAVPAVQSECGIPFHRRILLCADRDSFEFVEVSLPRNLERTSESNLGEKAAQLT